MQNRTIHERSDRIQTYSAGRFNLTRFSSNNKLVLMNIPENHRRDSVKDADLVNEELPTEKSLRGALKYRKKSALFQSESNPGIDSWVQPRLNLGFSYVLKPT